MYRVICIIWYSYIPTSWVLMHMRLVILPLVAMAFTCLEPEAAINDLCGLWGSGLWPVACGLYEMLLGPARSA